MCPFIQGFLCKQLCGWLGLSLFIFLLCLCLCKCWLWRKGTWGGGNHTSSFGGTLPVSWSLIRWAHTQHVPLVSSAWLTLPPEIKDGQGAAVLIERRVKWVCMCMYVLGVLLQGGRRTRVCAVGKGVERGHTQSSVCMCGGASAPSTSPAFGDWPLCSIHIKYSCPVKMTPRD